MLEQRLQVVKEGQKCRTSLQLGTGQKGTDLGTAAMQIIVFAGQDIARQYLGHEEEGLRGCCSSSRPAGGNALGCPVPQTEDDDSVRKSLWAYRSNP